MSKRPDNAICSNCVFYKPRDEDIATATDECHVDPPTEDGWPQTTATDWCGCFTDDWEPKPQGT
jgi:hypothetical protein